MVFIGATVKLRDVDSESEELYKLVGETTGNFDADYVEVTPNSPMGQALMKARVGETVRVDIDLYDQGNLAIKVRDNGQPPKDTAEVFDPEHSSCAHEPNINELGIIIGRKLLELMGGTVVLQDCTPTGLEATIRMPVRPSKG